MESGWVGESVDDDAVSTVDELFDSLGLNNEEPQHGASPDHAGKARLWAPLVAGLGLLLLIGVGAAIWILRSQTESTEASQEVVTTSSTEAEPVADVEGEAGKLRAVMSGLGLSNVDVGVREEKVFLTGSVPTDADLTTIRNAVISASDPALVNMNEIVVGGPEYEDQAAPPGPPPQGQGQGQGQEGQRPPRPPGPPPPGFVPPTAEQRANLQAELNRVLTDTPLVFDPGSTELNEVQLRLLETTIIDLLESHPGVPVRLVGYTDEQGDEYTNTLLSFDRAEAVQRYLIASGVPEFILRVEGRGEDDASGDRGADRRVEIEVIDGP